MNENCQCGHVADEHEETRTGYGACTVEGCDCIHYEENDDEVSDGD